MRLLLLIGLATIAGACEANAPSPGQWISPQAASERAASPPFVNRVWTVVESRQVAVGELRVFLSTGTLVMASAHATPAFGTWSYGDGRLTITEEGLKYDVEILELTGQTFRIRIHSPGEPVEIRFAPAESIESPALGGGGAAVEPGAGPTQMLVGTVHRLEVEGGVWVIRDAQGNSFQPVNLPDAFRKEGISVEAEASRRDNVASIGMSGTIVEIVRIRQRPGATP